MEFASELWLNCSTFKVQDTARLAADWLDGSSGSKDGKMVAIWDFDDTLVPWYQMKRAYGEQHILDLFDEW